MPNHVAPDHPWVGDHPEYFVRGNADDARNDPASFIESEGMVFACGRDPFFPASPDVLQLNAFEPGLRQAVIETFSRKVIEVFVRARRLGFRPVGLHQHLGSGCVRGDFGMVRTAVDRLVRKAREVEKAGFPLEFLDFRGGFGPRYLRNRAVFPVEEYIAYLTAAVSGAGLSVKALAIEPGKYMVGDSGVLLLGVEYVKESFGNIFACVDGGTYNTVPRPAIYLQAHHEIINASRVDGVAKARVTVAGNLCETGDVFGRERPMPLPLSGDVLAVLSAGAYCRSMASNFNLRDIPREILI